MAIEALSVSQVQEAIAKEGASWQAGPTSVSELSSSEKELRLGYVPGPGEPSLAEREQLATANLSAYGVQAVGVPASYDLRNVGGANYITPIKDQGGCGSCVAFGTLATVEGTFRRQRGNPNLVTDLSEAQLFYCIARAQGRRCENPNGGWWVDPAMVGCRDTGVADEACYPYTAGDQDCSNRCSDWQDRVTKISAWHTITAAADMKTWISTRGPLVACFTVYNDFFSYRSGVYRYVTGGVAGGHCVSCVGYDDAQGCWIFKNSWGTGFGESGFFRIAYGQCGIDAVMWAVDGIVETGWLTNRRILGLWTIDQDRNAWVYIDTIGWRRISADNDNIFFDMLIHLSTAKAANRPVNLYQEAGIIRQVYVF